MKIPIRSMIRAPKGKRLLSVDLSQAEAWVVAYLANDPIMKYELLKGDIHTRTAKSILSLPDHITKTTIEETQRYTGKKCNHAFNYLMGPERAAEVINKEGQITVTIKQTKLFRKRYLELYKISNWWMDVENQLKSTHTLTTPYGFTRRFYGQGKEMVKEGVAFLPQSTVADHTYGKVQSPSQTSGGLLEAYRRIIAPSSGEIKIIHSAHDSGMFEFPSTLDVYTLYGEIKQCLMRPMVINGEEFTIPVDGKYGEHWECFDKLKD